MSTASARRGVVRPSFLVAGLAAVALVLALTAEPAVAQASSANEVTVTAVDYDFQVADTLPPGPTVFRLANEGTVQHEVVLARLKKGTTVEELLDAIADEETDANQLVRGISGILVADPGARGGSRLLVDLAPGTAYAVVCGLRDHPDAPPHFELGMEDGFMVEGSGG